MTAQAAGAISWLSVDAVERHPADTAAIAAFSLDRPQAGVQSPGLGVEIDGWVIGRDGPVAAIRALSDISASKTAPVDVRRPDVATDYPNLPHAIRSGFTFWAPVETHSTVWRLTIQAILADGNRVEFATIAGHTLQAGHESPMGADSIIGPNFVIIGTQRGGTTSLHAYLAVHPQVRTAQIKELHFLTDRHERGRDWYLGQFPVGLPAGTITGEATPYALFHPLSPGRLREVAPDAKLIALLRNPVDRAYSHYLLERSRGEEALDFAAALDAEADRLAGEAERLAADPAYASHAHNHASYLARGDYTPQLERWFARFPRDQILILRSEDLYQQPEATYARVTDFLELSRATGIPFAAHNQSDGLPLKREIRKRLKAHFAPLNARLRDLLRWSTDWE